MIGRAPSSILGYLASATVALNHRSARQRVAYRAPSVLTSRRRQRISKASEYFVARFRHLAISPPCCRLCLNLQYSAPNDGHIVGYAPYLAVPSSPGQYGRRHSLWRDKNSTRLIFADPRDRPNHTPRSAPIRRERSGLDFGSGRG